MALRIVLSLVLQKPYLSFNVKTSNLERVEMQTNITPNIALEKHQYVQYLNADRLRANILELKRLLAKYPIIGSP